ncbi:MAG: response regulator [Synechococcales cyanobacterium C42_A2020_086]|jgi:chemotaxis protein histidine kinase CheA/ActR/RegA family two-component response regulator|nr:response regulator [Synechococcales cyanobacterium C42_A2020_086]
MSISEQEPSPGLETVTEAQLQQELNSLFVIDTQNYLQHYSQIAQRLHNQSWKTDIQELYRCIHTIKGGAVTVAAAAILPVTTALEDLLADLRYLEVAPPLEDGYLSQVLLEAGELLTSTLDLHQPDESAPFCQRIQTLHRQIRDRYLPQWNAQKQLQQEFAEQGLDMVVLELEIALERLPAGVPLPPELLATARHTLNQLQQIGTELRLDSGWEELLQQLKAALMHDPNQPDSTPNSTQWRWQWQQGVQTLKHCAKQGGKPVSLQWHKPEDALLSRQAASEADSASRSLDLIPKSCLDGGSLPSEEDTDALPSLDNTDVGLLLDQFSALDPLASVTAREAEAADLNLAHWLEAAQFEQFADQDQLANQLEPVEPLELPLDGVDPVNFPPQEAIAAEPQAWTSSSPTVAAELSPAANALLESSSPEMKPPGTADQLKSERSDAADNVQIPVALEKLDHSAQHLVDTLLTVRMTQGFHRTLRDQITQITLLAQEGIQYISQLRQIQDDYALLNQLKSSPLSPDGPTPERYRQGYIAINRLLEVSLRLSEIGAEAEKSSQQVTETLQRVDRQVLKLQATVEESRLVAFHNLSFRARAILRDLTTRYRKPARLLVQGEQIELDVSIARDLEPVLLHLIRNAYDHGIELPHERHDRGKPEQGTIRLSLQRQGNWFQLQIQDDGYGMDAQFIQARAEALGLPLTHTDTPEALLAVICQPGFSAKTQVSEISGRGVGMDVVAAQVARLGGRLSLQTTLGIGTTFSLEFPAPRLLVPCMLLQVEDYTFAIPVDEVKTTALFSHSVSNFISSDCDAHLDSGMGQEPAGSPPFLDVLAYWQPQAMPRQFEDTAVCICIQPTESQTEQWLVVDELLDQSELFIHPLPPPLIAPEELIGVSLQMSGALIPVLEPRRLANRLLNRHHPSATTAPEAVPEEQEKDSLVPVVLIVDDAALMRRRVEASLRSSGYVTHTCADGREAWQWLHDHPNPSLMITDIEMPTMDGFTLIERCRRTGLTMPILVISSRLSEEWFNEARRLGANDYLTKGFATAELLQKVSDLLDTPLSVTRAIPVQNSCVAPVPEP